MKRISPPFRTRPFVALLALFAAGCATSPELAEPVERNGDEIVAAGQFFRIGTPVVLWIDPGGYDAYRVERRFSPLEDAGWHTSQQEAPHLNSPNRFSLRRDVIGDEDAERVRGGGWDLPLLQEVVDQFVIHFDAAGTSRECFRILHDRRGLSVHFLLDLDGTIYQTLDLKERAWHATTSNSRSVGIEIAGIGAFDVDGDYPRDENGELVTKKLPDDELATYRGLIGHFHIQTNKVDPGPAFDWDRVTDGARELLHGDRAARGNPRIPHNSR